MVLSHHLKIGICALQHLHTHSLVEVMSILNFMMINITKIENNFLNNSRFVRHCFLNITDNFPFYLLTCQLVEYTCEGTQTSTGGLAISVPNCLLLNNVSLSCFFLFNNIHGHVIPQDDLKSNYNPLRILVKFQYLKSKSVYSNLVLKMGYKFV